MRITVVLSEQAPRVEHQAVSFVLAHLFFAGPGGAETYTRWDVHEDDRLKVYEIIFDQDYVDEEQIGALQLFLLEQAPRAAVTTDPNVYTYNPSPVP